MSQAQKQLGDHVHLLRGRWGWSQEEMAERAQISINTLGSLEKGQTELPQRATIEALIQALELDEVETQRLRQYYQGVRARWFRKRQRHS